MRNRVVLWLIMLLGVGWNALAQNSCPAVVDQALAAVGNNCANLERNTACYGYKRVEATFSDTQPVGYFSLPGDRAQIATLKSIRGGAFNVASGDWGVAVLHVQANVPDSLPGQAVTFVLMGDAELQNASTASQPPLQAFYFTTGMGAPACRQAPSSVAIESPDNLKVALTVNGATIQVGSFITLQSTDAKTITLTVQRGGVETEPGELTTSGQSVQAELDNQRTVLRWDPPRAASADELQLGDTAEQIMQKVVPASASQPVYYVVQPGDDLYQIALKFHTTVAAIASANGITNVNTIFVGQRLVIPNASTDGTPTANTPPAPTTATPGAPPGSSLAGFTPTPGTYQHVWNSRGTFTYTLTISVPGQSFLLETDLGNFIFTVDPQDDHTYYTRTATNESIRITFTSATTYVGCATWNECFKGRLVR